MIEEKKNIIYKNLIENKKTKLLNTNKNRRLLFIQIEKFFQKSNLYSLELSYENKISNMKELLLKFHILYKSLENIKSSVNKENENELNIFLNKDIIPNKTINFIIKKDNFINNQLNIKSNGNIKNIEGKIEENKKIKTIKSYINKAKKISNEKILKTEYFLNFFDKPKFKRKTEKGNIQKNRNKLLSLTSKNMLRKTFGECNNIKSIIIFNEEKIKDNKYIKAIKNKFLSKENYKYNYNNKYMLSQSRDENHIKKNRSLQILKLKNFNKKIYNINTLRKKNTIQNIKSSNKIALNLTNDFENKYNIDNKVKKRLRKEKEEDMIPKINNSFRFEHKFTFQNKIEKINNINIINNSVHRKESYSDYIWKNNSNLLFTKEKRKKQIIKNNIFFKFFIDENNYKILHNIYDFLYLNEKIKDGKINKFRNIKGPLRDIYLNKCISMIKKQLEKFKAKKNKKDDIWTIMEKEVLAHKLSKINEFIQNNNNKRI